jgi:quercetin dioxygenase-like cupin family protein
LSASHAERRDPSTPDGPLDLTAAGDDLLAEAQEMSSGRAARTLTPAPHGALKQTLVALRAGVQLSEHEANGPATIQLLRGSATINSGEGSIDLRPGEWSAIPDVRHDLQAHADTIALITVAPTSG